MDTDAGPVDFLNDVPGADGYDQLRSKAKKANAGGAWIARGIIEDLAALVAGGRPPADNQISKWFRPSMPS